MRLIQTRQPPVVNPFGNFSGGKKAPRAARSSFPRVKSFGSVDAGDDDGSLALSTAGLGTSFLLLFVAVRLYFSPMQHCAFNLLSPNLEGHSVGSLSSLSAS